MQISDLYLYNDMPLASKVRIDILHCHIRAIPPSSEAFGVVHTLHRSATRMIVSNTRKSTELEGLLTRLLLTYSSVRLYCPLAFGAWRRPR